MSSNKRSLLFILSFSLVFIVGGAIRILLYGVDFADCISQIYYGFAALCWGVSIRSRITDKRIRRLLLGIVFLLIYCFLIQVLRYKLLENVIALRYAWYAYYIAITIVPLLFFFVTVLLNTSETSVINKRLYLTAIPSAVLILLFLTNDFHELIFVFTDSDGQLKSSYSHGILFYATYILIAVLNIISIVIVFQKCDLKTVKKQVWVPSFFAASELLGVLSLLEIPKINGITVWLLIETYSFMTIGLAESCIHLGLIPANINYRSLFLQLPEPVEITSRLGEVVYSTKVTPTKIANSKYLKRISKPISGGFAIHTIDTSEIDKLNRELRKTTSIIESRNEYLKGENDVLQERSAIEARNRLYDNIAVTVKPQLDKIRKLIDDKENGFVKDLSMINVLNAYIKRRSNMELLKEDSDVLPLKELQTAMKESCEYLKLLCFNTSVLFTVDKELPADAVILLYEFFEYVIEGRINNPCDCLIRVSSQNERVTLRMLLGADSIFVPDNWNPERVAAFEGKITSQNDDESTVLKFELSERRVLS